MTVDSGPSVVDGPMRILGYGRSAVLVETDNQDDLAGLVAALTATPPVGTVEVVPAARTVLVRFDPERTDAAALGQRLRTLPPAPMNEAASGELVVPVRYDGADLDAVAERSGLSVAEVIQAHTGAEYTVAFCGFAPGFGYLSGLPERLRLPRRAEPRTRVPVGSVAIADGYTAVYPHASPGGWNLIGSTELVVWDVDRDPPNLFAPGTRVRFTDIGGRR